MANFSFDQAEGLRRMLAGPKPRIITFLSATDREDKSAMLVNLGASLVGAGSDVLLLDACIESTGIGPWLGLPNGVTLLDAARKKCDIAEIIKPMAQGFGLARLASERFYSGKYDPDEVSNVANTFDALVTQSDVVVVDGELDVEDMFPMSAMASSEIVVQVSTNPTSIMTAYGLIKRLSSRLGRRSFSILVTGASEKEAKVIYGNMAQAASRYLAIQLNSMGSVPADEHLSRATRLGRSVVDAYPLAGASIAFRRLAGRFAISDTDHKRSLTISTRGVTLGT
ncbi:MAG: MinD/ParA family protein [Glaciimonas sp.]|nr:MinD/ParA family protein [Glaciimonas sp.]